MYISFGITSYVCMGVIDFFDALCDAASGAHCDALLVILFLYNLATASAISLPIKSLVTLLFFELLFLK